MFFHQRFVPGLAIASYIVGDDKTKQAAVIDPTRDVDDFLNIARENGLTISDILETHVHADFASGSVELKARLNGKPKIHSSGMGGDDWTPKFADHVARDGDDVKLGSLRLKCIHTPGHTPEHVSWALFDDSRSSDTPWLVFTGDFLFVGDVGRPDLLGEQQRATLAHQLYDSTFNRIAPWPDFVEVFPAHGAGSLCGKAIGSRRSSSVGFERRFNPSLAPLPEPQWIAKLMDGMPLIPAYFPRMKKMNVQGPPVIGPTLPGQKQLDAARLHQLTNEAATILDVRSKEAFANAHLPNSINIPLAPNFPTWAGWLLHYEKPVVIISDDASQARQAVIHLIRIGFDGIEGFVLTSSVASDMTSKLTTIPAADAAKQVADKLLLDVRTDGEWNSSRVNGAKHIHLGLLTQHMSELPKDRAIFVICGSGYRASIAGSMLQRAGYRNVTSIEGGMEGWSAAGLPTVR
jgi:hydroxyacylglutathione hydrolase